LQTLNYFLDVTRIPLLHQEKVGPTVVPTVTLMETTMAARMKIKDTEPVEEKTEEDKAIDYFNCNCGIAKFSD